MFHDIYAEVARRVSETREHIDFIEPLIPLPPTTTPRYLNNNKGLIFIELYGLVEYTILQTVGRVLLIINGESLNISALNPHLLAMALDGNLEALKNVNRKKWDKRNELFELIKLDGLASIREDIMPTDGKNYTHSQIESIWTTFSITEAMFIDPTFRGRLSDIVVNRNNIAHGNMPPSTVGASFTVTDLRDRLTDVSNYCTYFVSVFEDYVSNKNYLK